MSIQSKDNLGRKQQYYDELVNSMTSDNDDAPDPGRKSSMHVFQQGARKQSRRGLKGEGDKGLSRSTSDSRLTRGQDLTRGRPERSHGSAGTEKVPPPLKSRHTFAGTSNNMPMATGSLSTASKVTGKRKRSNEVGNTNQAPENEQIFRGLHFYFFPNTDTHPARKMRIAKAVEFGAMWEKEFNEDVTHVVMDKSMKFDALKKFIKKETLPAPVVVVSEDYPAECISYRILLNPRQMKFQVKGCDPVQALRPVSSGSDRSLQLKSVVKAVQARVSDTPSESRRAPSPVEPLDEDHEDANVPLEADCKEPATFNVHSTKEFDAVIQQARGLENVPLDNDDEPISRPTSSEGPVTADEQDKPGLTLLKKQNSKYQTFQDKFQCMQKHTGPKTETPNAATIKVLQQMADYYSQMGDEWRLRAYRKAISTLRNHPSKVWTRAEASSLPQIGERLATKIEEIAFTNRLRRLENAQAEPSDQILQTCMKVYGVGFAQASKWVTAGYTSLDELLEKAELTNNQRIGIDHYEDFNTRIPRAEVEQHGTIVRKTLQRIDKAFEVIVGGSYRRGSETSSDIDCIITRPDTGAAHIRQVVIEQLVPKLFENSFFVAELAATSREDGNMWHGASQIPSKPRAKPKPWRRIDLLLVPSDELGAAMIYFTGNDIFNRSMRLLAGTKGMRLNQRGLYKDVIRGKGREKLSEGTLVEGKDEKKIFEVLGVPWRPPKHRIC